MRTISIHGLADFVMVAGHLGHSDMCLGHHGEGTVCTENATRRRL